MRRRTPLRVAVAAATASLTVLGGLAVAHSDTLDHDQCRPDGLYATPGIDVPYCDVYDSAGREVMNSPRRIIGYFTSWRHGHDGQPSYLASDIPWDKVTHLNYAFAHVNPDFEISVNSHVPDNPATDMTWPGVPGAEMDPEFDYDGHFNLLNRYKKQHPDVKTLIAVGGWAESGGFFDADGDRVDDGGFYRMTTHPDGSVNTQGIATFADSAVDFVRTYGFDGLDIDYEYATSMNDAGHPQDWAHANPRRAGLNASYEVLMRTLRQKLDEASAQDGTYYLLTVAAPSSGYLLRGMENHKILQYLDYVNIMSYDLHGAWNEFVGPNAALYDDGDDAELEHWNVYSSPQFGGIGYLNTDWAYHYFRGAMQPGRINIGVPYYTRGWRNVSGGTNGLWGTAPGTDCPEGLIECGDGAVGIDNLWHDLENGQEVGAGTNPLWHARNLADGRIGSYAEIYGLDPDHNPDHQLVGTYEEHYSTAHVAPWLWNPDKHVYLSTEDEQSLGTKAQYVVDKGIGGVMIWELAGDFGWTGDEWFMGDTMTTLLHDTFANAGPYGASKANVTMPEPVLDISFGLIGFPLGDNNFPISPELEITNNTGQTLPGGAVFEFDYPTSAPPNMVQQSGWDLQVISSDHTGHNRGGLSGDFHRVRLTTPGWLELAPGTSETVQLAYQLPISGPSNVTLTVNGASFRLSYDHPRGGVTDPTPTPTGSPSPTPTPTPGECAAPGWDAAAVYTGGDEVSHGGHEWRARWWTQGEEPGTAGEWGVWEQLGPC